MTTNKMGYYKRQDLAHSIIKQLIEQGQTYEQICWKVWEETKLGKLYVKRLFEQMKTNKVIRLVETKESGDLYEFIPVEVDVVITVPDELLIEKDGDTDGEQTRTEERIETDNQDS
jgi:hypothetical protein